VTILQIHFQAWDRQETQRHFADANKTIKKIMQMNDPASIDLFLPQARHTSWSRRCAAVEVLGSFADSRCIGTLINALDDDKYFVRHSAACALERFGGHDVEEALSRYREKSFSLDMKLLMDARTFWSERIGAAENIAKLHGRRGAQVFIQILTNSNDHQDVRAKIAEILGDLGDRGSVGALIRVVDEKSGSGALQTNAMIALSKLCSKESGFLSKVRHWKIRRCLMRAARKWYLKDTAMRLLSDL
jgi:HEAT repeat protein